MNLLRYYIQTVHSVDDVTNEFESLLQQKLEQPALKIVMTVDCCGSKGKTTKYFFKSEWEQVLKMGYYCVIRNFV